MNFRAVVELVLVLLVFWMGVSWAIVSILDERKKR